MIDLFVKKFFGNIVKNHVYHFSYQLVHIKGLHAKGFHFLSIFSLSFIFFEKKWSKWTRAIICDKVSIFDTQVCLGMANIFAKNNFQNIIRNIIFHFLSAKNDFFIKEVPKICCKKSYA